jgi:hypothetical protein
MTRALPLRRYALAATLALSAACALLSFSATPALAATHRGVTASIGSPGSAAGQLSEPQGVALNRSSNDLYVVDKGNHRVDEFEANGTFIRAWGWGVADGMAALETCTLTCQPGVSGSGAGQFAAPEAIAVDNSGSSSDPSKEDVYVTDTVNKLVDKFGPEGNLLGQITMGAGGVALKGVLGVAVDHAGGVWVYVGVAEGEQGEIAGYTDAVASPFVSAVESGAGGFLEPGLAVDSEGHFFAGHRLAHRVAKLESSGALVSEEVGGEGVSAFALDSSDNLYLNAGSLVEELNAAGSLVEAFGELHPVSGAGVAVGASAGPVYVVDRAAGMVDVFTSGEGPEEAPKSEPAGEVTATTAVFHGELNPGGKSGKLEYQFDFNTGGSCTGGQSVPVPRGEVSNAAKAVVEAKATGLQPSAQYTVCLLALDPFGSVQGNEVSLKTEPVPPEILGESTAVPVKATEATLEAKINPNNQETKYFFEYSEKETGGVLEGTIVKVPSTPGTIPAVFNPAGESVTAATEPLTHGTTYYYRVVAENVKGEKAKPGNVEHFTTAIPPETPETKPATPIAATTATLNGVLNPGAPGNPGTYEFRYRKSASECQGGEPGEEKATPATHSLGAKEEPAKAPIAGLLPHKPYTFCLRAKNEAGEESAVSAPVTFTTLAAAPTIEEAYASEVASTSATLRAKVNPQGAETSYTFEYAPAGGTFTPVPEPKGKGVLPEGVVGVPVSVHVQHGLLAGAAYDFRLVVSNSVQEDVTGAPVSFTTQQAGGAFTLPDGRQYEMVTPPEKEGALIYGLPNIASVELERPFPIQASAAGNAIVDVASRPTEAEPHGYQKSVSVLSTRGSGGWSSQVIAPSRTLVGQLGQGTEFQLFSDDLSRGAVQPFGQFEALSPEATESTAYLRTDYLNGNVEDHCQSSCYTPLVTGGPGGNDTASPFEPFGGEPKYSEYEACTLDYFCGPEFEGASPDLSHVIVRSPQLTATPVHVHIAQLGGLYEWSGGHLQLVSVFPSGEENQPIASLAGGTLYGSTGFEGQGLARAISKDGDRVIFISSEGQFGKPLGIYLRDVPKSETVRLDVPEPGATGVSEGYREYMTASADASRIFFLDGAGLTAQRSASGEDLYEYDLAKPEGERLTDLTVDSSAAAEVRDVLGTSDDGSYVYFVARGALAPGAVPSAPGDCELLSNIGTVSEGCNVYVRHEGVTSLVAAGWEEPTALMPGVSRVSPDGRWLAFMSRRSLTGYDNRDANSGEPDYEVYLYHAETSSFGALEPGKLVCASCNPTGARPVGEEAKSGQEATGSWVAANVPKREEFNGGTKTIYQPRYLSNGGRLFFDSHDALVPQDVNGAEDVYEYEPEGVPAGEHACSASSGSGSEVFKPARAFAVGGVKGEEGAGCLALISSGTSSEESSFLDASETGGDVFFLTTSKLVPQDFDDSADVYDAHACTSASPCSTSVAVPPPCTTESSCKPSPTPQPGIYGLPASGTFSGPGNFAPPLPAVLKPKTAAQIKAEKLAKAVKQCKKDKSKKKRAKCVKNAQKKYGAKASAKKSSRASKSTQKGSR